MIVPLLAYLCLILIIVSFDRFLPGYSAPLSALSMFIAPFLLDGGVKGFNRDWRSLLLGAEVSLILLVPYVLIMKRGWTSMGFTPSLLLYQLVYVAIPEETFFRGYLQSKFRDPLKGILIVSMLFTLAHVITRCLPQKALCGYALLTFFPSLVMGWLYKRRMSLWGAILFHWLANVASVS